MFLPPALGGSSHVVFLRAFRPRPLQCRCVEPSYNVDIRRASANVNKRLRTAADRVRGGRPHTRHQCAPRGVVESRCDDDKREPRVTRVWSVAGGACPRPGPLSPPSLPVPPVASLWARRCVDGDCPASVGGEPRASVWSDWLDVGRYVDLEWISSVSMRRARRRNAWIMGDEDAPPRRRHGAVVGASGGVCACACPCACPCGGPPHTRRAGRPPPHCRAHTRPGWRHQRAPRARLGPLAPRPACA